ncbi:MAG: hypothetical protein WBN04_15230 [Paracoccaceae bacterium]
MLRDERMADLGKLQCSEIFPCKRQQWAGNGPDPFKREAVDRCIECQSSPCELSGPAPVNRMHVEKAENDDGTWKNVNSGTQQKFPLRSFNHVDPGRFQAARSTRPLPNTETRRNSTFETSVVSLRSGESSIGSMPKWSTR